MNVEATENLPHIHISISHEFLSFNPGDGLDYKRSQWQTVSE